MLHHPDNDHWQEWREAVKRTGYTDPLKIAAQRMLLLDYLTPCQVEDFLCAINNEDDAKQAIYRNMARQGQCHCHASTNVADEINYGTGNLDFNGFWEFPCTHRQRTETV